MAAAPTPDPSQQPQPDPQGGTQQQGAPQQGAPSQAPAPPEMMALAHLVPQLQQIAQQFPATSAGLAKALAGINEAMSSIAVSQPQQQTPQQSPPY